MKFLSIMRIFFFLQGECICTSWVELRTENFYWNKAGFRVLFYFPPAKAFPQGLWCSIIDFWASPGTRTSSFIELIHFEYFAGHLLCPVLRLGVLCQQLHNQGDWLPRECEILQIAHEWFAGRASLCFRLVVPVHSWASHRRTSSINCKSIIQIKTRRPNDLAMCSIDDFFSLAV